MKWIEKYKMKKIKNITLGGIQQKVFNLVLIIILLVVAAYTVVIYYQSVKMTDLVSRTNDMQKQAISETSSATMNAVINGSLGRTTQMEAYIADQLFSKLKDNVWMLADYAGKVFAHPDSFTSLPYSLPDPSLEGTTSVQLLYEAGTNLNDPIVSANLTTLSKMSDMMIGLFDFAKVNACYVALPDGTMLLADDHPASKYAEDGSLIPIPIHERHWYQGAVETGELFFTDVEKDVFTGQIGIMCSAPVYVNGQLVAVAGADMYLDNMEQTIRDAEDSSGFTFIVNDQGHVVFSPVTSGELQVRAAADNADDLRESENKELAQFITDALKEQTDVRIVESDGVVYYMSGAPIGTVGWTVVTVVNKAVTDQPTLLMEEQYESILNDSLTAMRTQLSHALQTIIVLLVVILILGIVGALLLTKRIVKPLESMTKKVAALSGDNLQFKMEKEYRTKDEIQVLAESFAELSARTLKYVEQIRKVTAAKERIEIELNMATAIQASQLPRLFPAFPTRLEFDIYASMTPAREVGGDFYDFFMIDNDHLAMVMADVAGKGVPAALFMMVARVLIKSRLQNGESPSKVLFDVNNQLCESNDPGMFVTVWMAIFEISTGKGIAANAGHEHPAICRQGEHFELEVYRHSPAVATMEGIRFKEHEFELKPGDSFFVYTDGVAEATNAENELFGTDRMLEALNRKPDADPQQVLANVMDGINEFVKEAEQFDDITMLCFKYTGPVKD